MALAQVIFIFLRAAVRRQAELAAENVARLAAARRPRARLEAAAAAEPGPHLPDLDRPPLGELALRSRHRPTGDRDPLAQTGLPPLLAMEVAIQETRPAQDRRRDPQVDSAHVVGESDVGNAENPLGAASTWLRSVESNRTQVQGPPSQATITDLANIPG